MGGANRDLARSRSAPPIHQPKVMGSEGYRPRREVQEGSALLVRGSGRNARGALSVQAIAMTRWPNGLFQDRAYVADLRDIRVVVTIPPEGWFGGYDRVSAFALLEQIERRFGTEFYQLDTTPWANGSRFHQQRSLANLRAFRPELAISLSNAGYALLCSDQVDGATANLFTDVLGIPLIMPWDHGLFQFPSLIPHHLPGGTVKCEPVLARIRGVLDHPLMHHLPIDGGQVTEMRRIGMLGSGNVTLAPAAAYSPYLDFGRAHPSPSNVDRVIFVGNVYAGEFATREDTSPVAQQCEDFVTRAKRAAPLANSWGLLIDAMSRLSPAEASASGFDFDHGDFWRFADDLIRQNCNMIGRTGTLEAIRHKVGLYGEFASGTSVEGLKRFANIEYKGFVDFAKHLPSVYAGAEITLDVSNAAFITNCSSKPICCLAAGGFPLFDYKPDVIEAIGSDAAMLMYRSVEELNTRIDYYLSHPREKRQLARSLQERVRKKCDFAEVIHASAARILNRDVGEGLLSRLKSLIAPTPVATPATGTYKPVKIVTVPEKPAVDAVRIKTFDVRRDIRTYPYWPGARIVSEEPLIIQMADESWSYSAYLDIEPYARLLTGDGRFWFTIMGHCVDGNCGIGLLYGPDLVDELAFTKTAPGSAAHLRVPYTDGLKGVIFRCEARPSALIQIDGVVLLREPAT
jgi:hypothetical protein